MADKQTWSSMTDNLIIANMGASKHSSSHHSGWIGRTKWTYVRLPNGDAVVDPMMGFYRNPPPGAQCLWSSNHGRQTPVLFDRNDLAMPPRQLTKWSDEKLAAIAAQYSQTYWADMSSLVRPETFEDLYKYFDSATLWANGAYNMWNLVNMLVTEAHCRWPAVLAGWKNYIDNFVNDFIHVRPGYLYNRVVLRQWDGVIDILDHAKNIHGWPYDEISTTLDLQQQDMVREALISHHMSLRGRLYNTPQYYPWYTRPTVGSPIKDDEQSAVAANLAPNIGHETNTAIPCANTLVRPTVHSLVPPSGIAVPNALAAPETSAVLRPCSSAGPLLGIPEEPDTVKTAVTVPLDSSRINSEPVASRDSIRGSEMSTSVPDIIARNATPPHDELARDSENSSGTINTLALDAESRAMGLQVQGRNLSVCSAPENGSEPMLDGSDVCDQKRVTREAPAFLKGDSTTEPPQRGPGRTPEHGLSQKRNVGRQSSGREQHKSSHNGPSQHQNAEIVPAHRYAQHPQRQMPFMASPDARPLQRMVPNLTSPNGLMLPCSQPVSGPAHMPPDLNIGMPHGPPPPPPPPGTLHMCPPIVPFQHQLAVTQDHTGQMQLGGMSGPILAPTSMPPPFNHSQHQESSFQQPNGCNNDSGHKGHGASSRNGDQNASHFNHGIGRHNKRHNTANANTQRKIRDDPIHGAVYALGQQRKNSSSSSGRRPSIVESLPRANAGQLTTCKNTWWNNNTLRNNHYLSARFHECYCPRCEESTRSAFVKTRDQVDETDPEGALLKHFAKFAPFKVKEKKSGYIVV